MSAREPFILLVRLEDGAHDVLGCGQASPRLRRIAERTAAPTILIRGVRVVDYRHVWSQDQLHAAIVAARRLLNEHAPVGTQGAPEDAAERLAAIAGLARDLLREIPVGHALRAHVGDLVAKAETAETAARGMGGER